LRGVGVAVGLDDRVDARRLDRGVVGHELVPRARDLEAEVGVDALVVEDRAGELRAEGSAVDLVADTTRLKFSSSAPTHGWSVTGVRFCSGPMAWNSEPEL